MPTPNIVSFWHMPLSRAVRRRLASIDESRVRSPRQKMALADKLLDHGYDPTKGFYVPLSSHVYLPGKLTESFAELRKYKEYCGYCAVFSANKSVHFQLVFDTRHLINAPFDLGYEERLAHREQQSAIMHNAHQLYWDRTIELMNTILRPPLAPDL